MSSGSERGHCEGRLSKAVLAGAAILIAVIPAQLLAQPVQTEADAYTRYELLAPGDHSFRITYEITATTAGAKNYYNPIRPGSVATDESVIDRATGRPLAFSVVDGNVARADGVADAKPTDHYIRVTLERPVPPDGGEGRILIYKTYQDPKSYYSQDGFIVFDRSLGIKRNVVILPKGYEIVSVNTPSQILQEPDGRLKVAFWNDSAAPAPLIVKARQTAGFGDDSRSAMDKMLDERAHQNRNIVYYLQQPETHSFDLTHDYTESTPGASTYVNVVRSGSRVSKPSARNIDTGAALAGEVIQGESVKTADPEATDVTSTTTAVVFHYPAVKSGESIRLRIAETYSDPEKYKLVGDELVWRRTLGRPVNAVILPIGWILTNSSVPATVELLGDGRVRLDFTNPRTDEVDTIITAHRRPSAPSPG